MSKLMLQPQAQLLSLRSKRTLKLQMVSQTTDPAPTIGGLPEETAGTEATNLGATVATLTPAAATRTLATALLAPATGLPTTLTLAKVTRNLAAGRHRATPA